MGRLLRKQGASAAPKPSSVKRFKHGVAEVIGATVEGLAGLGALIGAPVAMVLGKLFLAVILGAVALGVFLRFADRQRRGAQHGCRMAQACPAAFLLFAPE